MLELRLLGDSEAPPQPDGGYGLLFFDASGTLCKRIAGGQILVVDQGVDWQVAIATANAAQTAANAAQVAATAAAADAAASAAVVGANVLNAEAVSVAISSSSYQSVLTFAVPADKVVNGFAFDGRGAMLMQQGGASSPGLGVALSVNGAAEIFPGTFSWASLGANPVCYRLRGSVHGGRLLLVWETFYGAGTVSAMRSAVVGLPNGQQMSLALRVKLTTARAAAEYVDVLHAQFRQAR